MNLNTQSRMWARVLKHGVQSHATRDRHADQWRDAAQEIRPEILYRTQVCLFRTAPRRLCFGKPAPMSSWWSRTWFEAVITYLGPNSI